MASPMLEGRSLNPREKAHFTLHLSDRIANDAGSPGAFSSIKFNHKPAQLHSTSRTTRLTHTSADRYALRLQDKDGSKETQKITFTGQRQTPKRSFVLIFDPTSQKATLEPLASTYTFNLATQNGSDHSSKYTKVYPKRSKDEPASQPSAVGAEGDDLFDESAEAKGDNENEDPDADNPYDFRHFMAKNQDKRGDESPFVVASSPDSRTGTSSAMNTPLMAAARKPAAPAPAPSKPKTSQAAAAAAPKPRKRKSPGADPLMPKKTAAKKPPPAVRLDRRATAKTNTNAATTTAKTNRKATASTRAGAQQPPASKIKSAEVVHSSDESDADADADAEGDLESSPAAPHRSPSPRAPRNQQHHASSNKDDNDESDEDDRTFGLEIEVPDAHPSSKPRALASLGLGTTLGLGALRGLRSPSNGPISLASAANSVEGSPNGTPRKGAQRRGAEEEDGDVIDFGSIPGRAAGGSDDEDDEDEGGGYEEDAEHDEDMEEAYDRDVEPMDLGPPAQTQTQNASRKMSVAGAPGGTGQGPALEDEEDDPLYKEMMEGLAGGESSEESEEE